MVDITRTSLGLPSTSLQTFFKPSSLCRTTITMTSLFALMGTTVEATSLSGAESSGSAFWFVPVTLITATAFLMIRFPQFFNRFYDIPSAKPAPKADTTAQLMKMLFSQDNLPKMEQDPELDQRLQKVRKEREYLEKSRNLGKKISNVSSVIFTTAKSILISAATIGLLNRFAPKWVPRDPRIYHPVALSLDPQTDPPAPSAEEDKGSGWLDIIREMIDIEREYGPSRPNFPMPS